MQKQTGYLGLLRIVACFVIFYSTASLPLDSVDLECSEAQESRLPCGQNHGSLGEHACVERGCCYDNAPDVVAIRCYLTQSQSNAEGCVVSEWTTWSECHGTQACRQQVPQVHTVSDSAKNIGYGRAAMAYEKELKMAEWRAEDLCEETDNCPLLTHVTSTGPAPCEGGYAGIFPCRHVNLLAFVDFEDLGLDPNDRPMTRRGNDMWAWHDLEYDDDYIIMGLYGGATFVRITEPTQPEPLGILPTTRTGSPWRDIKVVRDHAFIGSEAIGHGMQVFDLTQLRGLASDGTRRFQPDYTYTLVGNTHNVISNPQSDRIYLVGAGTRGVNENYQPCDGGLHILDVSEPKLPRFIGCFSEDGYTHDAQCIIYDGPDSRYHGREICFAYNEDTFTIVDTTNASWPVMVSRMSYDDTAYCHQGWTSEDLTLNFMNDELDEQFYDSINTTRTLIWNIEDLENPVVVNVFQSTEPSIDHNLYVKGNYVHESNYLAGYRLLQINSASSSLQEVAHFDVFPQNTKVEFGGTWSNYPWLKNDVVAVSSINLGLFLLQVDYRAILTEELEHVTYGQRERYREILLRRPNTAQCPGLLQEEQCDPPSC